MRRQSGLSLIAMLYLVGTLGIIGAVGIKVIPEYIEYYQLKSIFNQVAAMPDIREKHPADVQEMIRKRAQTSAIYNFDITKDAFVGIDDDLLILEFKYEREAHVVANIDMKITFEFTKEIE